MFCVLSRITSNSVHGNEGNDNVHKDHSLLASQRMGLLIFCCSFEILVGWWYHLLLTEISCGSDGGDDSHDGIHDGDSHGDCSQHDHGLLRSHDHSHHVHIPHIHDVLHEVQTDRLLLLQGMTGQPEERTTCKQRLLLQRVLLLLESSCYNLEICLKTDSFKCGTDLYSDLEQKLTFLTCRQSKYLSRIQFPELIVLPCFITKKYCAV